MHNLRHINSIHILSIALTGISFCSILFAATETPSFDRYNVIIERNPFGEISPPDVQTAIPASESFVKHLELRAIIDDGSKIRVAFLNKKSKKTLYMTIGEVVDGIKLVSVNYDVEEVILSKGDKNALFTLKSNKSPSTLPSGSRQPAQASRPTGLTQHPFFSKLNKQKLPTFRRTDVATPFRGQSIDSFLKAHPEVASQYPSPIRESDPTKAAQGKGETIEYFLQQYPEAVQQFAPIQPPKINLPTEGKGKTIEEFLREHSEQFRHIEPFVPIQEFEQSSEAPSEY